MLPIVVQLRQAGYRLGVLSNTCEGPLAALPGPLLFSAGITPSVCTELPGARPQARRPRIYRAAAQLAGVASDELFFVDDIAQHVVGAKAAGIDAVQYTSDQRAGGRAAAAGDQVQLLEHVAVDHVLEQLLDARSCWERRPRLPEHVLLERFEIVLVGLDLGPTPLSHEP